MSLLKWTLAAAGTAMGMRYMSDRRRRRLADGGSRQPQTDRDDGRSNAAPWSDTAGRSDAAGRFDRAPGTSSGAGAGRSPGDGVGSGIGGISASRFDHDDLLAPDSGDPKVGNPSNRT